MMMVKYTVFRSGYTGEDGVELIIPAKMAGMAGMQAKLVAENIIKMVNGDNDIADYQPFGPAIVVPIGPEGGSGQLPGQDELASREMVSSVKGRDLMVDRYAEILGITTPVPN